MGGRGEGAGRPPTAAAPPGECQWLHLDLIKDMQHFCRSLFPVVRYAYCTIPTYPSGQIGFMLCSKNPVSCWRPGQGGRGRRARRATPDAPSPAPTQSTNFQEPVQLLTQKQVEQMQLRYYNSDVHRAAFVLPEFARKVSPGGRGGWKRGDPGLPGAPTPARRRPTILLTSLTSHQALNDVS